jgi:hypothetical protein
MASWELPPFAFFAWLAHGPSELEEKQLTEKEANGGTTDYAG